MEKKHLKEENRQLRLQVNSLFMGEISFPAITNLEKENEFLRFVLSMYAMATNSDTVSVIEYLDYPPIKKLEDIPPEKLQYELDALLDLMEKGGVSLVISGSYPPEVIYRFITDTLVFEEVCSLKMPGLGNCFHYEDYHPNAVIILRNLANHLLQQWYWGARKPFDDYLSPVLITPSNQLFDRQAVLERIGGVVGRFGIAAAPAFSGSPAVGSVSKQYLQVDIFETTVSDDSQSNCQGMVRGRASVFQPGHSPANWDTFSFHFKKVAAEEGWQLYYFELPGFEWK
ncbi:MAG: hypothetical protein QM664_04710 [Flavihumibacter sp.]